jgi:tetratricopeptide (TPR) repeat protein
VEEEEATWTALIHNYGSIPEIMARAVSNRGNARARQGKLQEALVDYGAAIELAKGEPDAYLNRGTVYESLGRFPDAIRDYDDVVLLLGINSRDLPGWNNRGSRLFQSRLCKLISEAERDDEELEDMPQEEKERDPLHKARIRREVGGQTFTGIVVDMEIGKFTREVLYRIRYTDGDIEHFTRAQVAELEDKSAAAKPVPMQRPASNKVCEYFDIFDDESEDYEKELDAKTPEYDGLLEKVGKKKKKKKNNQKKKVLEYITDGHIINGGFPMEAGDNGGGIIALILSLLLLCGGFVGLVKLLQMLLIKKTMKVIAKATQLNDYISILVGIGITIVVQSSSVTTSALTPLCGMGIFPLEKIPPP